MCQTSLIELRAVHKSVTDRLTDTIVKCIVRRSHLVGVELNFYIISSAISHLNISIICIGS